jgi:hypothetical protein
MKSHYSPLAVINNPNVSHLSEIGQQQVYDFCEYLRPRYQAIVDGAIKKEEVARYYLGIEEQLTDAAKKLIGNVSQALGISKGYISKVKSADKFMASLSHNQSLKNYVEEHPVSCVYLMTKVDQGALQKKMMSGENFTQRELEDITKKSREELDPAPEVVVSEFQRKQKQFEEMVNSEEYPMIRTTGAAQCFCSGNRKDKLAAAAQVLLNMQYRDDDYERILSIIIQLAQKALERPYYQSPSISVGVVK